ncbi:hypothetical protein BC940DRAFT_295955 [Gongronella butleri]|nr:hypothetical protein BC940DRAFT_295955 [Gongronella butleri]
MMLDKTRDQKPSKLKAILQGQCPKAAARKHQQQQQQLRLQQELEQQQIQEQQALGKQEPVFQRSSNLYALASPPAERAFFDVKTTPFYTMYEPLSPPPQAPPVKKTRARANTFHHHRVEPEPEREREPLPSIPSVVAATMISTEKPSRTIKNHQPQGRQQRTQPQSPDSEQKQPPPRRHSIYGSMQSLRIVPQPLPAVPPQHRSAVQASNSQATLVQSPSNAPVRPPLQQQRKSSLTSSSTASFTSSPNVSSQSLVLTSSSSPYSPSQPRVSAAASAAVLPAGPIQLEKSKSTPLRTTKIKTYNVGSSQQQKSQQRASQKPLKRADTTSSASSTRQTTKKKSHRDTDGDKRRRQQELEELISGRRGSTLKLSLTPKNGLLN